MPITTIIVPSKSEKFFAKTIQDILEKATGEIDVIGILDGYELLKEEYSSDPRVRYIHLEPTFHAKKRQGINRAVSEAKGDYVMSVDAHCMFAHGFDEQLIKDHEPNWIQIPRRRRLNAEDWMVEEDGRPPVDYEYIMFRPLFAPKEPGIHGFKWDERTLANQDKMIDDTIHFQGSCWFMTKEWFQRQQFMDNVNYMGWGQESEELGMTTWKNGGYVKTNKNTWYAHLHKGTQYGRMYHLSLKETRASYAYSHKHWLVDNNDFFIKYVERFPQMPGWPNDWRDRIRSLKK